MDLVVGISYDDNIGQARDTLMDIMTNHEFILVDPIPPVVVLDLADSSVNLAVRCWASISDYWSVRCDVLEHIKTRFDKAGINMLYPQQKVAIRYHNGQDN